MQPAVAARLLSLNAQFYQTFALQFSRTRQRLQNGVLRLLPSLAAQLTLLDLGCGSGELACQLAHLGFSGPYAGIDFSPGLLAEAQRGLPEHFQVQWLPANLAQPGWTDQLVHKPFSAAVAFAVFHHLPGQDLRAGILQSLHACLHPGSRFYLSNWQFLNSPRLAARIQPWERLELDTSGLDAGDYLLDWRQGGVGLRYVHQFSPSELAELAALSGFQVLDSFYSDGKTGNLSLYQVWESV
jgi:SAM-dependent methyltransferase